jgi:hypothetical protein
MFTRAARRRRRWRRCRRLTLLFAAAVVAAAAAQHYAQFRPASPARTTAPHTGPGTAATPANATAGAGRPDLRWADFHGIELPVSAQAGPLYRQNGLAWGFTDTPLGAVLAAVNIGVRTAAQWGPGIYQPTITHEVTGPDAHALLTADDSDYAALQAAAHVAPGQPAGRGYAVEAAYRLAAYTPRAATADIVSEGPASNGTTVLAVTRIQLVWLGGDWRVIAPPGGTWASSATTATSMTGYTTFPNEG